MQGKWWHKAKRPPILNQFTFELMRFDDMQGHSMCFQCSPLLSLALLQCFHPSIVYSNETFWLNFTQANWLNPEIFCVLAHTHTIFLFINLMTSLMCAYHIIFNAVGIQSLRTMQQLLIFSVWLCLSILIGLNDLALTWSNIILTLFLAVYLKKKTWSSKWHINGLVVIIHKPDIHVKTHLFSLCGLTDGWMNEFENTVSYWQKHWARWFDFLSCMLFDSFLSLTHTHSPFRTETFIRVSVQLILRNLLHKTNTYTLQMHFKFWWCFDFRLTTLQTKFNFPP